MNAALNAGTDVSPSRGMARAPTGAAVWTLLIRPKDGWLLVTIDAAVVTISAA